MITTFVWIRHKLINKCSDYRTKRTTRTNRRTRCTRWPWTTRTAR